MEIPKYRVPHYKNVVKKTWTRVKGFVLVAFPIIIVGSAILGAMKAGGLLDVLSKPAEPLISGWLMLPAVAGITLIYGVLRKELALEMLILLGGTTNLLLFMSPLQIFVFALVITIYIPCIATIAVLKNELGTKNCILISMLTVGIAILIGGLAARLLIMTGWL